jgi:hypothetical protein
MCPSIFPGNFYWQSTRHTFKGYDPNRTTSDTGGIADEQKVRTTGLAESEFSTWGQSVAERTESMRTSSLAPESS